MISHSLEQEDSFHHLFKPYLLDILEAVSAATLEEVTGDYTGTLTALGASHEPST
jgi:hypothetical protein